MKGGLPPNLFGIAASDDEIAASPLCLLADTLPV